MNNYDKALKLAKNQEITNAMNILYPHIKTDFDKKLFGLLLYRFGDYKEAYSYLKDFPEYKNEAEAAVKKFEQYSDKIMKFVQNNKFKQALDAHHNLNGGSVTEKNIEGCLYALCGRFKEAEKSFVQAVLMDKGSVNSAYFLEGLSAFDLSFKKSLFNKIKEFFE